MGVSRSTYYYKPEPESEENQLLMRLIDEQYTKTPFYGRRRMSAWLCRHGYDVNEKRVARLMEALGLQAIYPKPKTSLAGVPGKKYPYLLKEVAIVRQNQVWSSDITYIRLRQGYVYLVAIIDWYSRYVLSWEVSTSLDSHFCVSSLEAALQQGKPEIFNTDQGVQFTSQDYTGRLEEAGVSIS